MNAHHLVKEHGSPLYVYDLAEVDAAADELRAALPPAARLYYSLKANPHPAVVRRLGERGCGAEVSSTGELRAALDAGVAPEHCLYTGPATTSAEIAAALAAGVRMFSVESAVRLRRVAEEAARQAVRPRVLLRVNPDETAVESGLAMSGTASQFGIDESALVADPGRYAADGVAVVGIHVFGGTNVPAAALPRAVDVAARAARHCADALGIEPEVVDLGGGFPHPYADDAPRPALEGLRAAVTATLDRALPGWRDGRPAVAFESGRFLAARAGTLVCAVEDVKLSRGRRFVVLDSGINHLGGLGGLGRLRRPAPVVTLAGPDRGHWPEVDVVGPLCSPLDAWARGVRFPVVSPGDVVTIGNVGAYGLTASLTGFLSRPFPVEVVVDGGSAVAVSRVVTVREEA